ncbi:MAG: hypothetical protein IZT55_06845 [Anaerolineae bacterium]|nr:hypothetical protein [Anaerolineae bacterium]
MKNYKKEITLGILFATIFVGLLFWFVKYEPKATLQIAIAVITLLVAAIAFVRQILTRRKDLKAGAPEEDEFTKHAKLYASSRAFLTSYYLWFLIFIFHTSFSDREEMLGIGMLGSALIYGIFLLYYKRTGDFNAE